MTGAFYFGCMSSGGGHALHGPGLDRSVKPDDVYSDWPFGWNSAALDTGYAPPKGRRNEQPQGHARVTLVGDWTVLSFWDRSGDSRGGSHSTFVLRGACRPGHALELARSAFPEVFSRIEFEIKLEGSGWIA